MVVAVGNAPERPLHNESSHCLLYVTLSMKWQSHLTNCYKTSKMFTKVFTHFMPNVHMLEYKYLYLKEYSASTHYKHKIIRICVKM